MDLAESKPIGCVGTGDKIYGYDLVVSKVKKLIYIVGSYAQPTAGCDTIKNIPLIFDTVAEQHKVGRHVIFEGLFAMNLTRGPELAAVFRKEFRILQLTTPLGNCLVAIDERRAKRGEGPLEKLVNTKGNYVRAVNYCSKMRDAGALVYKVSREEALPTLLELLQTV